MEKQTAKRTRNMLELTKEDNDIILNHLYKYNEGVDTNMKMAMDSYVETIEFVENDFILHMKRIKPILDESCGITEDVCGESKGEIGKSISIKLSQLESPYNNIVLSAIREIKLKKLGI